MADPTEQQDRQGVDSVDAAASERAAAFMDIGTNSVRLIIAGINANLSYKILRKEKEMVRLGDGGLIDQTIRPEAIDRAVLVCSKFADLARSYGDTDITAVATSATREASNRIEFIERLAQDANLDVRVISGLEEARLIYLGVSRHMVIGEEPGLFIDIGGGSTEVMVGDDQNYSFIDSLQLGAIRLTNIFFLEDETGPVTEDRYRLVKQHVYNRAIRTIQKVQAQKFPVAIGSSGTLENLADIAVRHFHGRRRERDDVLRRQELDEVIANLCSLPLEQRREVPGINPRRADIIIAGAAIIDVLMESLGVEELQLSDRGLQDGLLVDYLAAQGHDLHTRPLNVRERSVLNLARACGSDEAHSRHVAKLADQLFVSARKAGLHDFGDWERELLSYAATLHDVGMFLSYPSHEQHGYYIIRNAELLGFDQTEVAVIATTALFHRKKKPRKKNPEFAEMNKKSRAVVLVLSMLLSMAESLDRSHTGAVVKAKLSLKKSDVILSLKAQRDYQLEVWNMEQHTETFRKVFNKPLIVRAENAPSAS